MHNVRFALRYAFVTALLVVARTIQAQVPLTANKNSEEIRLKELSRRVEVKIALVDRMPIESSAPLILRHGSRGDFIVLDRTILNRDALARAIYHLALLRDIHGDTAQLEGMVRAPDSKGAATMLAREGRTIDGMLARIVTASKEQVDLVGFAKVISVYLPSAAMKRELDINVARASPK